MGATRCLTSQSGHKIKNPSRQVSQRMRQIQAHTRLLLTGTPIQNSLKELWALFDFVCNGTLLGSLRTFNDEYSRPIEAGTDRNASDAQKKLGIDIARALRETIAPHFLRREKKVENATEVSPAAESPECSSDTSAMPKLLPKNDFIVWTYLSDTQVKLYRTFLESQQVQSLLNQTRSPLAALNVLKKICDHPRLVLQHTAYREALGLGLDKNSTASEDSQTEGMLDSQSAEMPGARHGISELKEIFPGSHQHSVEGVSVEDLIEQSGKLRFLVQLMDRLKKEGHRCLIFSQSLKMLDSIYNVLLERGCKMLRIDGSVKEIAERQRLVEQFNQDENIFCFLLTTQVCLCKLYFC